MTDSAGQPSSLPRGWQWISLGQLGRWTGGGTPSKASETFWMDGTLPWVSPKDMKQFHISETMDYITEEALRSSPTRLVPENSVLMVTRSGILQHSLPIAVNTVPVTVNQDLKALTPWSGVDHRYVAHGLRAMAQAILSRCSKNGTTVASIDTAALQATQFPLAPAPEQHRIVEALESYLSRVDDAVATLERVQRNLKRCRASVLKAAVEGRLVPTEAELAGSEDRDYEPASVLLERILVERRRRWEKAELAKMKAKGLEPKNVKWKAKYKVPVAPDTSGLPELPEGWCWATVDQLSQDGARSLTDGPFGSNLKTAHYTDQGPRVIRLQNIGDGVFLDERAHISEEHYQSLERYSVSPGDILISSLGTELPRACVVPDWLGKAIVKADCIRFAPHPLSFPKYLMFILNSAPTRKRTEALVHGVGRPRIGLTLLRGLPLAVPPRAEQRVIVAEIEQQLSIASEGLRLVGVQLGRCIRLRQAILKWAFEGKLVDQDPCDEPASELLARIKAKREAAVCKGNHEKNRRGKKARA